MIILAEVLVATVAHIWIGHTVGHELVCVEQIVLCPYE